MWRQALQRSSLTHEREQAADFVVSLRLIVKRMSAVVPIPIVATQLPIMKRGMLGARPSINSPAVNGGEADTEEQDVLVKEAKRSVGGGDRSKRREGRLEVRAAL